MAGIVFYLFAQSAHEDINRPRSNEGAFFPHGIEQVIAGEDASAMTGEVFEKAELADRGWNGLALDPDGHGGGINFQVSDFDKLTVRCFLLRAENVSHACDQFPRAEWLGDVAVAARVERLKTIGFLCAGG